MIQLPISELRTLYAINRHAVFPAHFRPMSRRKLERAGYVENVMPSNKVANYQLTLRGERLLEDLVAKGELRRMVA